MYLKKIVCENMGPISYVVRHNSVEYVINPR